MMHTVMIRGGGEFDETGDCICTCGWSESANSEYLDRMADEHLFNVGATYGSVQR